MARIDRTNATHHVYRCYDDSDRLVYVGSSADLFARLKQHRSTSWWAGQVVRVSAKVYPTGVIARQHERRAIRTESPRWNKSGRWDTRHTWTRDQYDDWMFMLIQRKTFVREIRNFVNLYHRQWFCAPPAEYMEALAHLEAEAARQRVLIEEQSRAQRERTRQIEREDELAMARDRKERFDLGVPEHCDCRISSITVGLVDEGCDAHEAEATA